VDARQPLYLRFTGLPAMLLLLPLIFAINHLSSGYTLPDLAPRESSPRSGSFVAGNPRPVAGASA